MTTDNLGRIAWETFYPVYREDGKSYTVIKWDLLTASAKQPWIRTARKLFNLGRKSRQEEKP